ncbi:subtilase family protein [Kribbella sp. VKM Ac-2527]|uniref:Subtilase family protein n=1 Tax=Kribbella caucasensis TaxID=2512215 RepID=A0A4R6KB84_9ACTN|nr:S8 family serine peptidase [Kribbella sp. VKM Ac-2527]TDO45951.1 subtilase family protein [Kribbella sp. VKM Ac-2527]
MNVRRAVIAVFAAATLCLAGLVPTASAKVSAATPAELTAICADLFGGVYDTPSAEPLAVCQWNMAIIDADQTARANGTGEGVTVGVLDTGVDLTHPDIAPNLDVARSCSFLRPGTPTAAPAEIATSCDNKAAVQDIFGHGTHVASLVAAPINGIGIAGVAPDATLVALKACTAGGFCFVDSVAAALRYAGDQGLDVVNMSLFADPFLYYCNNDAAQRAMLKELQSAARYAQQRGVVLVASAGNEADDLQHPTIDEISPDYPPDTAETRRVRNNCRVAPAELPGVVTVSATGPVGYPGYTMNIAEYSSVGMGVVEVAAPGGDYFSATDTVQDAVLGALPNTPSVIWDAFDPLEPDLPGITVVDQGARYGFLNGTSMAAPHTAGVAALIRESHPGWSAGAVAAAVQRMAAPLACPANWQPIDENDDRQRCYGSPNRNSFFGAGLVNATNAATE